ncbi:MAG TPA: hypothetical protein VN361_04555 [Oxalicibacterium sp.]|nr:hypothetical protein [Oxalicibacterium sp.]
MAISLLGECLRSVGAKDGGIGAVPDIAAHLPLSCKVHVAAAQTELLIHVILSVCTARRIARCIAPNRRLI